MDRRKFMREVAAWSAAAVIPVFSINPAAIAAERGPAVVSLVKGKDWSKLAAKALAPLGGIQAFVKKGRNVCIKPNISFDTGPDYATNTHPSVVKAVAQMCLDAGAAKVTVFDNTLREQRRCYVNSGVAPALETIKDKRLNLVYTDERQFVPVKIKNSSTFSNWKINKMAVDADVYINIPVAKHHGFAKLSMGLKNIIGAIGGRRGKIHANFDNGIAELNSVLTPQLTIIDGTRILLDHGPSGGSLDDVAVRNTLIASADTVAADAVAAKTLFGMDPADLRYVQTAYKIGLGEMDLSKIKVVEN